MPAWTIAPPDPAAADFAVALGVHPLTAMLLRRRGIATTAEARRFLDPRLEELTAPDRLRGMPAAVDRVARAIDAGERVAIHGDYDVDGISATAILVRGLRQAGADPLWYLPHRLSDGYGLGIGAVEALAAQGTGLLIAADCGITALDAVARARALGMDVIVLDHHTPLADRPPALLVEPIVDDGPPAPLCAAGLAFMFIVALRKRLGMHPEIPAGVASLAALGTVADVVPLVDDNRRLVAGGLAEMRAAPLAGVRALAEIAGIVGPVRTWHVSWQLAPRLNAPGRLGDPSPSLRLLLTDDATEAGSLAQELDRANRERQDILERTLAEAIGQAEADAQAPALVVAGEGWHPGVVGLVAGRLTERYRRPAIAIGLGEATGRGSARSVPGFNLVDALGACRSHLVAFGGHAMAAGMTIARQSVAEFRSAFTDLARVGAAERTAAREPFVDAEVRLADLTPDLLGELERLGPFGAGAPEPVLAVRGVRTLHRRVVGDGRHVRLDVSDGAVTIETIGFAMAGAAELLIFTEAPADLAVVPERDPMNERVTLRIVALDVPGVDPEGMLADTGVLVDRLFSRAAEYLGTTRDAGVEDAPSFYSKLVGVTFDGRQEVVATLRPGDRLRLVREPANPHDPHAVRVMTEDGRDLGYLRAQLAGRVAPSIDAGVRYRATAAAVTGGGERSFGINVLIERDEAPVTAAPASRDDDGAAARPGPWAALQAPQRAARVTALLRGTHLLAPIHEDALAAIAAGAPAVIALPPGRGVASILAGGAAVLTRDHRCALVVAPLRRRVLHRADQIRARLAPLGMRVYAVHGLQDVRERERVDAAIRAGEADVVVVSAEVVAGGWLEPFADRVAAVLCDGLSWSVIPPPLAALRVPVHLVNPDPPSSADPAEPSATVVRERVVRGGLRLVDRRGDPDPDRALEEVFDRDEKCLIYAAERDECVRVATQLRARAGEGRRVAYLHGGLPARVRQIIMQAFCENRIGVLVTTPVVDEEALPRDVRHIVLAALPADRAHLADAVGALGFEERAVVVTALFRSDEMPARRRALDAHAPERTLLVSLYRALARWPGEEPLVWPDDATWRYMRETLPEIAPAAIDAALAIFEEAGVVSREMSGGRSEIQCLPTPRRDLAGSLRYREGQRERDAFEACARWAVRAGPFQLLQVLAGGEDDGQPVRPETQAAVRG